MIARLALAAALLGSAAGAASVLAADDESPPRPRTPPAVRAAVQATPQETPPPLPAEHTKLVAQVPDAEGAEPWAIRAYTSRDHRQRAMGCWELGRLSGEQFGWVDGHGAFTAKAPGRYEVPMTCYSAKQLKRTGSAIARTTTITYAPGRSPQPGRSVTWGPVDADVVAVTPAGEPRLEVGDEDVILQVKAGEAPPLRKGTFARRDGSTERFDRGGRRIPGRDGERPVAGTETVAVRAPDPAGGEPWGVVVQRGDRGGLCYDSPGRLIGTQIGYVDAALDTFMSTGGFEIYCGSRPAPTRAYPLRMTTLVSSIPPGDDRGEIERRVLSNRLVFWGRVHPDVERVTIRTPRDARTLIPSKGFILAIYDGQFPGGKATATAHLRGGKEVTRSLYVG